MRAALFSLLALAAVPAFAADAREAPCAKPEWPAEARRYELEGATTLQFGMDEEGNVVDPVVRQSSRWELLDRAAIKGLQACKFGPGLGQRSKGKRMPVQYVWSLDDGARSHPMLVEGSCMASARFSRFAA